MNHLQFLSVKSKDELILINGGISQSTLYLQHRYIIKDLKLDMAYQGLVNEGATCYLNSLLQTLFMTRQFRENIYSYVHDPKKIDEKDSIPFQLQKLFVNLQTSGKSCHTRDLLRSFQWTEAQAFQQHDVQQFCRKLFDAIEASHKNTFWIKELFGFIISSYINCGMHCSTRSQQYLDLSLPVRNLFTQQLYESVEECLKAYLLPEQLQGVQCSGCQSKVTVKKGLSLESLPSILTLQLNRFQLNYDTMQREKINSFLYFPELLELHRLMKPYNQIELKGVPNTLKSGKKIVAKQKSRRTTNFEPTQIKPKRKTSDDKIAVKEHVTYLDEQNKDKRQTETKQLSKQQEKARNLQILASLKQNKFKDIKQIKKPAPKKLQTNIQDDMLFGTLASGFRFDQPSSSLTQGILGPVFTDTQTKYEHQQQSFDMNKEYPDGTYALYAVLVHSGGSYGGHYYAYIFDGENWYKFNDSNVQKVSRFQARQYGQNSDATNGTNAYLLFYRNVKTFKSLNNLQIPVELLEKVKIENEKSQKRQQINKLSSIDRQKRIRQINDLLLVKVFSSEKPQPLIIKVQDKNSQTIISLREKIKNDLKLPTNDNNWRLRRYNKTDQSLHQVYDTSLGEASLQSIGFRENIYIFVQTKTQEEVFEEYDPRKITVKVNIWQPNVIMMSQKKSPPLKIKIHETSEFSQLYAAIQKQSGIQKLLVTRKNYTSSQPISTILLEDNKHKQLIQLRFFNNIHLYVEELTESIQIKWAKQFENERFRCYIKFNNPKQGEARNQQMYFDNRRTLGDLKKEISQIIGIPQQMFRLKKGKQMPELTLFKKKLSDLKFINNEFLYIEQGKSSQGSIVVKKGTVSLVDNQIQYFTADQLQFDVDSNLQTAYDLCFKISQVTSIPAQNIRVRQFSGGEFRQIFSDTQLIMRLKTKNLVWEQFQGQKQRGYQIYYRVFNVMTMQIGPLKQFFVENTASYDEFTLLLQEETGIQTDKILIHKSISNYCDISSLFDCEWLEIKYINDVVKEQPLSLRCDGLFLIIKQAPQAYKPPKNQTKPQKKDNSGEAQLKITVVAQKEEIPEEKTQEKPSSSE